MPEGKHILFLADINSVHTERWVRNLIDRGYLISIFSLSQKNTDWIEQYPDVKYKCAGFTDEVIRSKAKFAKASYFAMIRVARLFCSEMKPDILHAHYASSYGMLAMRLKFPRTILSLWGSDVYEFPRRSWLHRQLFRKIVNAATVVCSTSQDMADEANKYVKKQIHITPFGIDTNRFQPRSSKNEIFTIGTVKSLERVYGIDRLLVLFAAFKEKTKQPMRLKIYGKGSEKYKLELLAKELRIENEVDFLGFVSGEELVKAFNSLDVFVALSRSESFGVAVLEAEACGVPVIVNNVGGLKEVMSAETGFLIEEDRIEEGLLALEKLLNVEVKNEMGLNARQFVLDNYSESVCVDKLIEVYDSI